MSIAFEPDNWTFIQWRADVIYAGISYMTKVHCSTVLKVLEAADEIFWGNDNSFGGNDDRFGGDRS